MNADEIASLNQQLRKRVAALIQPPSGGKPHAVGQSIPFDLIVTHNEVNRRHGTGVILQNMFPDDSRLICVRAQNDYNGEQAFGASSFCLPRSGLSRLEM